MNFAVSNIAWTAADDQAAHAMLREFGIKHLEIAPTRFWSDLTAVTESEARSKAEALRQEGLQVCAFQALLFGRSELQLFGADRGRALIDYVKQVSRIAAWMGAKSLVFGSPKNRLRGELAMEGALQHATAVFREIGDFNAALGVVLCLEPNPPGYGGDFLCTAPEAADLVRTVNSPGIGLNFDMGEVIMNSENAEALIRDTLPIIGHFHVSEPMLESFSPQRPEHQHAAATLRDLRYAGVVSVEMKTPTVGLTVVREAVQAIQQVYGG